MRHFINDTEININNHLTQLKFTWILKIRLYFMKH